MSCVRLLIWFGFLKQAAGQVALGTGKRRAVSGWWEGGAGFGWRAASAREQGQEEKTPKARKETTSRIAIANRRSAARRVSLAWQGRWQEGCTPPTQSTSYTCRLPHPVRHAGVHRRRAPADSSMRWTLNMLPCLGDRPSFCLIAPRPPLCCTPNTRPTARWTRTARME